LHGLLFLPADAAEPDAAVIDKNLELMRHFSEQYAQRCAVWRALPPLLSRFHRAAA
jgi:hypothetical protein